MVPRDQWPSDCHPILTLLQEDVRHHQISYFQRFDHPHISGAPQPPLKRPGHQLRLAGTLGLREWTASWHFMTRCGIRAGLKWSKDPQIRIQDVTSSNLQENWGEKLRRLTKRPKGYERISIFRENARKILRQKFGIWPSKTFTCLHVLFRFLQSQWFGC